MRQQIAAQKAARSSQTQQSYRIPIIVHVVHNGEAIGEGTNISAAQVYSQIDVLNEDFNRRNADAANTRPAFADVVSRLEISFEPAQVDPDGVPLDEPGIRRYNGGRSTWTEAQSRQILRPSTIWDPLRYFNIWSLNLPDGELGYAQFPSFSGLPGLDPDPGRADTDGVIIDYTNFGSIAKVSTPQLEAGAPYNLGRTLTHELGHAFGLIHIWGDGGCQVDDFCEDTPPSDSPNYRCDTEPFKCQTLDMYENYMDYTRDVCMNAFTADQVARMIVALENADRRRTLLSSTVANPITEGIFARFAANKTRTCAGGVIAFTDDTRSFNGTPIQLWQWTFDGGEPPTASVSAPFVRYPNPGSYAVGLYVEDFRNNNRITIPDYVQVVDISRAQNAPFAEDFQANINEGGWQSTNGWEILNLPGGNIAIAVRNALRDLRGNPAQLTAPLIRLPEGEDFFAITFDLAYALPTNPGIEESLSVWVSDDCGGTRTRIWQKSGTDLATAATIANFAPLAPTDWRAERVFIRRSDFPDGILHISLDMDGQRGNNLYIDNFSVQATTLNPPLADFVADMTTLLEGEATTLRSQSTGDIATFSWQLPGAEPAESSSPNPTVRYPSIGTYNVSLTVANPAGNNTRARNGYIRVLDGARLDRLDNARLEMIREGTGFLAGHNAQGDLAKAELFVDVPAYETLFGVDLRFGAAEVSQPDSYLDVVIWTVGSEGAPDQVLLRQELLLADIQAAVDRNMPVRVIFDRPIQRPPNRFFVGIALNYQSSDAVGLLAANRNTNTGWEQRADGSWLPYERSRNRRLSHAIYPLFTPGTPIVAGLEKNPVSQKINVFPNPVAEQVFWSISGALRIYYVDLLDVQGRVVRTFSSRYNDGPLDGLAAGIYFLHFTTSEGIGIKRIIVQNR